VIEFSNVVKSYDGVAAVNDLNLAVRDLELCVLLGESGCGKSTTLNMVNRLIEPDSGAITINGKNVSAFQREDLRRGIGYVVQSVGLFPHMTVAQNISVVPQLLRWDKERILSRIKELIAMMGLEVDKFLDKYPGQLSGGEAQRIGVARALAADPNILLMDEPFGAVDPLNRANLQNEFLKFQRQLGKTVIFVTHDIGEAMKMGDRIAVMSKGVLRCYGTPKELLTNKENEFVRGFMGNDSFINILSKYGVDRFVDRFIEGAEAEAAEADLPIDDSLAGDLPAVDITATLKDALAAMIERSVGKVRVSDQGVSRGTVAVDAILAILKEG
jgi:osmoprotectant transport system ATP-binding protein